MSIHNTALLENNYKDQEKDNIKKTKNITKTSMKIHGQERVNLQ